MQFATLFGLVTVTSAAVAPSANTLNRRGDGEITCGTFNVVSQTQERENFVEGQNYLRSGITCGAVDGKCSRVSCSNDAAVWLCNNSGEDIEGMDCAIAADYVDHIFDQCQEDGLYAVDYCTGTQENTDGWNIEVGRNTC